MLGRKAGLANVVVCGRDELLRGEGACLILSRGLRRREVGGNIWTS